MSETLSLPDLMNRIDILEQRIRGGAPDAGTVAVDTVIKALRRIGAAFQSSAARDNTEGLHLDLSEALRNALEAPGPGGGDLSLHQAALIQLVEYLFRHLEYSADLDPVAYAVVQHLQPGLVALLLSSFEALAPGQPAWTFCRRLVDTARGYDRHAGPAADTLMRRLAALAATTAQQRPEQAFAAALQRLDTLLDTHDRGAMALTRELVGNEQGEALYSDSRQLVSREILGAVQGHRLPRLLLLFLQHIWSKYLYVTYLRKGMDSPDWQRGLQDIQVLVKSFSITDPDDLLDFYAQELARTLARVRVQTSSIHGDRELAARFFELMDAVPIRIMGGDPPAPQEAMVTAVPESVSGEGPEDIDPTLTDDLRVGQWYLLRERELEQRCRLVERNAQFHYCLFTNLSGIKTARLDLLEVAERRRAKQLRPISTEESIPQGLAFACRELARQLPRLEQEADKAERERAAQAEHRRARETAERLRRRHQQQVQEQARLLEEQRRQEQERLRLQAEAREATERQTRERALQKALTDVARIQSGGMLDTVDADGGRRRLRLGLKLKSNGKLIFVDRLGRKELELFPNELAQRLVAGSAAIADFGVAFDDTLGRLINDRSERIHADEER